MQVATDEEIFDLAAREGRVIVFADTDLGTLLALRRTAEPSIVIFRRSSERRPDAQARLLLEQLPQLEGPLQLGSVVVIEENRLRIRPLPMGGGLDRLGLRTAATRIRLLGRSVSGFSSRTGKAAS